MWKALTDPDITERYFFGCRVRSDWKPGSPISFSRKILWWNFKLEGRIVEIRPEQLLKYILYHRKKSGDGSRGHSTVTFDLEKKNEKTVLHITDDIGTSEDTEKRYRKSQKGWDRILRGLKKIMQEFNTN